MAEREGFEPPEPLPAHLISSQERGVDGEGLALAAGAAEAGIEEKEADGPGSYAHRWGVFEEGQRRDDAAEGNDLQEATASGCPTVFAARGVFHYWSWFCP